MFFEKGLEIQENEHQCLYIFIQIHALYIHTLTHIVKNIYTLLSNLCILI